MQTDVLPVKAVGRLPQSMNFMRIFPVLALCVAAGISCVPAAEAVLPPSSFARAAVFPISSLAGVREEQPLQLLTPSEVYGSQTFQIEARFVPPVTVPSGEVTAHCTVGGRVLTHSFSGPDLTAGQPVDFVFNEPISAAYGEAVSYQVWLTVSGQEAARVEQTTTPLCFRTHRRTVLEKGTGMWCPYCPTGIVAMDSLALQYPDDFIGISLHSHDALENYDYIQALNFSTFPSGLFNRKYMEKRPMGYASDGQAEHFVIGEGGWGTKFLTYQAERADADIDLYAEYAAPHIKLRTETRFAVETGSEKYQIAFVVVEDEVTSSAYYQKNDYAGAPFTVGGFEKQPGVIRNAVFNHVGRAIFDDVNGIPGSVPEERVPGEKYTFETELQLPEKVDNPDKVRMVAMLLRMSTGEVVNARQVRLIPDESTGIGAAAVSSAELRCEQRGMHLLVTCIPPAEGPVELRLHSLQGTLLQQQLLTPNVSSPVVTLPCPAVPGVYILSAVQHGRTRALRLVVR